MSSTLDKLLDTLNPYALLLKVIGVALLLGAVFLGGCRMQAAHEVNQRNALKHKITILTMDRASLADALDQVNAKSDMARRAALAQQDKAKVEVAEARKDAKVYARKAESVEDELRRARRSPTCATQLELELCVPLL